MSHLEQKTILSKPAFSIQRVEELDLSHEQDGAIAELVNRVFNADLGGRSFAQNRHHRRYMIWQEAKLAAHLAICFRAIRLGHRLTDIVGIGEVVVDPEFRKRGMASALLNAALVDGEKSRAEFALLFGTENLYRRAGFVSADNILTITSMAGAVTSIVENKRDGAFMVKQLCAHEWDFEAPVDLAGFSF